jgi:hypothetical protein
MVSGMDLQMPADFPHGTYMAVEARISQHLEGRDAGKVPGFSGYAGGWNDLAVRFRSADEYGARAIHLLTTLPGTPPKEDRYAVLATAYGAAFILTARRPWPTKPEGFWGGLTATPAAKLWFGLAFALPESFAWGILSWLHPTSTATQYLAILWFLAPGTFLVCAFVAHAYSIRDVKRTILAGLAPSYVMSPDGGWWRNGDTWASVTDRIWWNGSAWVNAAAAVPEDALRSPDGNYWWTGTSWCAMPPRTRRTSS